MRTSVLAFVTLIAACNSPNKPADKEQDTTVEEQDTAVGEQHTTLEEHDTAVEEQDTAVEAEGDSELDLEAGCWADLCPGIHTAADAIESLGMPAHTGAWVYGGPDTVEYYIYWGLESDVELMFSDADGDGVLVSGDPMVWVSLNDSWPGTDTNGLGIGDRFEDFVEVYGPPFVSISGEISQSAIYTEPSFFSLDDMLDNDTGTYGADGRIDSIVIY